MKKRTKGGSSAVSADERRKLFVGAYLLNNRNATQAAIAAGFSEKSAHASGSRLLKHVKVRQLIDSRQTELLNKYALDTDDVYRSLAQELHFNPKSLYNEDGSLKAVTDLDDDVAMALAGIEMIQLGTPESPVFIRKLKWAPKASAREQLIKIRGMYARDNEQNRPEVRVLIVPPKAPMDL